MTPEQFTELMQLLRGGFLMLAMIGYANVFDPTNKPYGMAGKMFLVVVQTAALAIAAMAMKNVLL